MSDDVVSSELLGVELAPTIFFENSGGFTYRHGIVGITLTSSVYLAREAKPIQHRLACILKTDVAGAQALIKDLQSAVLAAMPAEKPTAGVN